MTHVSHKTKRFLSGAFVLLFVAALFLSIFFLAQPVRAASGQAVIELSGVQATSGCDASPGPPCVGRAIKETASTLWNRFVAPTMLQAVVQALTNITQYVANRLAYEAAVALATAGTGQETLFYGKSLKDGWEEFGLDIAGKAVEELGAGINSGLGTQFDFCAPSGPNGPQFTLQLQLGIIQKYKPEKPKCDINEVLNNWSSFISESYESIEDSVTRSDAILSKLAESLKPGRTELSGAIRLSFALANKVELQKELEAKERAAEKMVKDKTDPATKRVTTPGNLLEKIFERKMLNVIEGESTQIQAKDVLNAPLDAVGQLGIMAASTFTNTLLSQLLNRAYNGLFDLMSEDAEGDPFNVESLAQVDQESQKEKLAGLFVTTPITMTNYNVLNEFVVCPPEGVANRGLDNCVMDTNFLSAVTRGTSGAPMTLQEAIGEGLIDENFKLISPEKQSTNQDPMCYTYAFCYSNLVKLRKARVIPIGWELAALRNNSQNPKSLKDIMIAFHDCNDRGTLDNDHPFCHLIDPNWVLKYPDAQCRAVVNGEIRLTSLSPGRQSLCVDAPSCIGEDSTGKCTSGYGYCVQEKNVWRFRGDVCSSQYAGCFALASTTDGKQNAYLIDTVDFSVCGQDNAGCQWYRTNKEAATDGAMHWLLPGKSYSTAAAENSWKHQLPNGGIMIPFKIPGTSDVKFANGTLQTPARYSYQDRIYLTRNMKTCSESDGGCAELIPAEDATLNMVVNPSFETDEDKDGVPDGWFLEGGLQKGDIVLEGNKAAVYGTMSLAFNSIDNQEGKRVVQYITIQPKQFYTLSFSVISGYSHPASIEAQFLNASGDPVSTKGLSSTGCEILADSMRANVLANTEWKRHPGCLFTVPVSASQIRLSIDHEVADRFDAVQLEPTLQSGTNFVEGLSGSQKATYMKVAPDYLGCTGAKTDFPDCKKYAQMCTQQDVGCDLYLPQNGNPSIPAIANDLDFCPAECAGYDAFKQEKTRYDDADFPLYFIPDKAVACQQQFVGCDSFTNLASSAEGGEQIEHYTNLRACMTTKMTDATGTDPKRQSATFFTWEGSDQAGYQLRSWVLLESSGADTGSILTEKNVGRAPCTKWRVSQKTQLVCEDELGTHLFDTVKNPLCNDHEDIFNDPYCREFFDVEGYVHYRLFSQTVTINDQCLPYRKDQSSETDCNASGGYWDANVGFCRYFGLASESAICPAEQNGCRFYSGGTGQNAVKLLNETFENGSYFGFSKWFLVAGNEPKVSISNESVATDGHSLRVAGGPSGYSGFKTSHAYLNPSNKTAKFDPTKPDETCKNYGHTPTPSSCQIDIDKDGVTDCEIKKDASSCGTLVNKIVKGKTYLVEFWAKGSGNMFAGFEKSGNPPLSGSAYDLVKPSNALKMYDQMSPIQLSGSWQLYQLGPLDTSSLADFDQNYALFFFTTKDQNFFIDNLMLTQTQENIALIKNSWVVPATCDTAPNGIDAPQYYLGCQAYTNKKGEDKYVYQFTNLCSENVVGCSAFYQTFQDETAHEHVSNIRCATAPGGDVHKSPLHLVSQNTACTVNGVEYCTIAVGRSYCTFDYKGTFGNILPLDKNPANPPAPGVGFGLVYGPETVVTPGDRAVFIVDNGKANCSEAVAGCQEVGKPKFSQDLSAVESFESVYFVNDPAQYESLLCDNEALFCDEFKSTKDGNFYFKNPLNKTCSYQTDVQVNGKKYSGWFRTGANPPTPCDPKYVTGGNQASLWKNGDKGYEGWVAECPKAADLCTEFIDVVDTEGGLKKDGTSYYFLNNDKLSAPFGSQSSACNGRVSQKQGCALFNNRSSSELKYNASVSYVLSAHANVLLNRSEDSLVDPVNCAIEGGGVYPISDANKSLLGLNVSTVNLCQNFCEYQLDPGDRLLSNLVQFVNGESHLERSCLTIEDCPTLRSAQKNVVKPFDCWHDISRAQKNDSNLVQKVNRDRSCSAWLACNSSRTSWNERTNKYEPICDSIDLCTEGEAAGEETFCKKWDPREPKVLTDVDYSKRDVTWSGYELSGFSIPNQLPVEWYDQFNINPEKLCMQGETVLVLPNVGLPKACETDNQCEAMFGKFGILCKDAPKDFRLVYNAGPCDAEKQGIGGSCTVGTCEDTGAKCSSSADCGGKKCKIGYCQETAKPGQGCVNEDCSCSSDAQCPSNFKCDPSSGVCVDKLIGEQPCGTGSAPANGCSTSQACVISDTTVKGSCFNNRCLTDVIDAQIGAFQLDGKADALKFSSAQNQSCRGYPEVDSPYPSKIVTQWSTPNWMAIGDDFVRKTGSTPSEKPTKEWSAPFTFVAGYQDSKVCAVDQFGNVMDCDCSYDKVSYGKGLMTRFESPNSPNDSPVGFCSGGPFEGHTCASDADCTEQKKEGDKTTTDAGTCLRKMREETMIGWKGYCIERDTSIQLYGSTEAADRACLTWLPVDQLTGATDLYAKYTSAGYEPQDTLYCAEVGVAFDLETSDYYCAETLKTECQGGLDKTYATEGAFFDNDPYKGVNCPLGTFAVMAGCGDAAPFGMCSNGQFGDEDDDDDPKAISDVYDDWPYFCVPFFSYHANDAQGKPTFNGEPCLIPTENPLTKNNLVTIDGNPQAWSSIGVPIYLLIDVSGPDWSGVRLGAGSYADCRTRGFFSQEPLYQSNFASPYVSQHPYLACRSLVQTSREKDGSGVHNAAWTDRIWKNGGYRVLIGENSQLGISPDHQCAETKNISFCSDAEDDEPWTGVFCGANEFAIMGPCDSDALGNLCVNDVEDNDYPYVCVSNKLERIADDNSIKPCSPPKDATADQPADYIAKGSNSSTVNSSTVIYAMTADKWLEFRSFYQGCYLGSPGYTYETPRAPFGSADPIANQISKSNYRDPFPHRILMCQSGNVQVSPLPNGNCPDGYTKIEPGQAKPFYDVSINESWGLGGKETTGAAINRLKQLYAMSFDLFGFTNKNIYPTSSSNQSLLASSTLDQFAILEANANNPAKVFQPVDPPGAWQWDDRKIGDNNDKPTQPRVIALGPCFGTKCKEGKPNAFSVNAQDGGAILGSGALRTTISFFTYANSNQMPIRRIIADWGNGGKSGFSSQMPWPTDFQAGSDAPNNFYKNHRGLNAGGGEICGLDLSDFGRAPEACSSNYVTFTHDYVCTEQMVNKWEGMSGRECEVAADGRLLNSPCTGGDVGGADGKCVFQPRVHVKDNWGWCTGFCNAGDDGVPAGSNNGCFEQDEEDMNECNISSCPSEGKNPDCADNINPGKIVNPWVNYDGYIILEPAK